jgi:hypothetical protein
MSGESRHEARKLSFLRRDLHFIIIRKEESVRSPATPLESQSSFERFSEYEF